MYISNLRTTSLNNAQLNAELTKRNAKTFGTLERKQQRLQRFIDAETKREEQRQNLRIVIENEQRKVIERAQARATELRRSTRISQLLSQYLGY
jgi:hypothetical protein